MQTGTSTISLRFLSVPPTCPTAERFMTSERIDRAGYACAAREPELLG